MVEKLVYMLTTKRMTTIEKKRKTISLYPFFFLRWYLIYPRTHFIVLSEQITQMRNSFSVYIFVYS